MTPAATEKSSGKSAAPFSPFPAQTHWKLAFDKSLGVPPAYDGERGYFSIEGDQLAAYDLNSGMPRWLVSARPASWPVVAGGLLFLDQTDALVALRTTDGTAAWQTPLASKLTVPLSAGNGRLLGISGTSVFAYGAEDGSLAWRRDVPAPANAAPTIVGDRVYVPTADRIVALRAGDGAPVWERRLGGATHGILAANQRLFVGSSDNFLYCLNARDGQIEWRWRTGADVVSLPMADETRVYFVSLDNVIRALNQRNGVQQWKRALPFRPAWGPVKAADTLLLTGIDGPPRAFTLKEGTPAGELVTEPGAEIAASLHVFDSPGRFGPTIVAVTRQLASGATVIAASRSIDPPVLTTLMPLPGYVPMTPAAVR